MATSDQRAHALALMQFLIAHRSQIGYAQARPMATFGLYEQPLVNLLARGGRIQPDCSEMVTLICRMSGYQDPNGSGYNGYGNSGSMYQHLGHVTDPAIAHTGSIVVFGPAGGTHAAMVMTPGADPMLFSHGTPAGPEQVSLSALTRAVGGPAVFLNTGGL